MNKIVLGYVGKEWLGAHELCNDDFTWVAFKQMINNGEIKFSCDALFLDGTLIVSDNSDYSQILNTSIPKIGMMRLSKLEQHLLFTRLGIKCPKYYHVTSTYKYDLVSLLSDVPDEQFLIIKSFYGARGADQFLVKKKDFVQKYPLEELEIKDSKKDNTTIEKEEQIKTGEALPGGNTYDQKFSIDFFKKDPSDFLITEKISLKREFRIHSFAQGEYQICERHLNTGHFQNNLSVGAKVSYYGQDWSKLEQYKDKIIEYSNLIHEEIPEVPYFSMDVYVNENDEVGMFEFCQQFGYKDIDYSDVRNCTKRAIEFIYKSK